MRAIAEPFFGESALLLGPTFALVFFVAFFLFVSLVVVRTRPSELHRAASLPLTDTSPVRGREEKA